MSAGLGGAAGMVVNKDDKNAGIFEGFFEDFPWVNDGRRYTTNGNGGVARSWRLAFNRAIMKCSFIIVK